MFLGTLLLVYRIPGFFSLMADKVTDASNKEQVIVCLRTVDDNLEPHEDFIGMHHVDSISSKVILATLKDTLLRMNLPLSNCRGQCFDGAANMCGAKKGVATQISSEEPRYCYGHGLNQAVCDTVKNNRILQDTLHTTFEI